MFKLIDAALRRRERTYRQERDVSQRVGEIMARFCREVLDANPELCISSCVVSGRVLTIQTNSKVVASELSIRLGELTGFLQLAKLTFIQIRIL